MDMDVAFLEQRRRDADRGGAALDDPERGLGALAHHFAELAGQDQLAGPGNAGGLDDPLPVCSR